MKDFRKVKLEHLGYLRGRKRNKDQSSCWEPNPNTTVLRHKQICSNKKDKKKKKKKKNNNFPKHKDLCGQTLSVTRKELEHKS